MVTDRCFAPVEKQKLEPELWLVEEERDFEAVDPGMKKWTSGCVFIFCFESSFVAGEFEELSSGKLV